MRHKNSLLTAADAEAYDLIKDAFQARLQEVPLPAGMQNTVCKVVDAVLLDSPEIFWIQRQFARRGDTLYFTYLDEERIAEYKSKLTAWCDYISERIPAEISEMKKVHMIASIIAKQARYGCGAMAHTVIGCLPEHSAVCDGISKAFKLLIEANTQAEVMIITGTADFIGGFESDHAWNLIHLNDKWFHVDLTGHLEAAKMFGRVRPDIFRTDREMMDFYAWDREKFPESV